jgi:Domain of unknown function (DUF4326)
MVQKPTRIQLSRQKGWRLPDNSKKVDRSTPFGNPFVADKQLSNEKAIVLFTRWLEGDTEILNKYPDLSMQRQRLLVRKHELKGKNLACWCPLGGPCHADVLLELVNR